MKYFLVLFVGLLALVALSSASATDDPIYLLVDTTSNIDVAALELYAAQFDQSPTPEQDFLDGLYAAFGDDVIAIEEPVGGEEDFKVIRTTWGKIKAAFLPH